MFVHDVYTCLSPHISRNSPRRNATYPYVKKARKGSYSDGTQHTMSPPPQTNAWSNGPPQMVQVNPRPAPTPTPPTIQAPQPLMTYQVPQPQMAAHMPSAQMNPPSTTGFISPGTAMMAPHITTAPQMNSQLPVVPQPAFIQGGSTQPQWGSMDNRCYTLNPQITYCT